MTSTPTDVEPARLAPGALAAYVRERLEERVTDHLVAYDQLTLTVAPDALPMAVQLCRDDPALGFDFFDFLTGVDEREDGFAVVVHLYSTHHRHHIQLRALAEGGRDEPTLPTISHLYRGADWHERETYDMFGITFEGHPGLLPRILTVENFEGFPLRKEFLLMTREVKPWPGLKEPKEATDDDDGDGQGGGAPSGPSAEDKARMAREKAERAKAKAAEARKRRAEEKAAGQAETAGTAPAAETETPAGDGDVSPEKDAALDAGSGDDQIAGDPQQAAAVADDAIAKDAAAGTVGGDTAAGASSDAPGTDQPVEDDAREAELAGGGAATVSGTPGVESEGRHAGAEEQAGDVPAADTEGMVSDTQDAEPAPPTGETPTPESDEVTPTFQGTDGGAGLPPRGPGEEEPRALAGDGVRTVPLADQVDADVTGPADDARDLYDPMGTDADDRLRDLRDDRSGEVTQTQLVATSGRGIAPTSDEGDTDEGATDNGYADEGVTDEGATDEGVTDEGATDEGVTDKGDADEGVTDRGVTDEGVTDEGVTDQGAVDDAADGNAAGDGGDDATTDDAEGGRDA